jgi:thiamine biosynthesis lipoprotein
MNFSDELFRSSNGLFDVTVAPVVNLLARTHGKVDKKRLNEALELVDATKVVCRNDNIRLGASGMAITLDGVAKGYIADRAADVLHRTGMAYMVDAGGDIRVHGSPENRPWRIAVQDPDKNGNYPAVIELRSGAVATSGGYESSFNQSGTAHHLLNPDTGLSPQYVRSVSVKAPTVMQADGLATALSLMHPREALRLTNTMPGHACLLVTTSGVHLTSRNWGA